MARSPYDPVKAHEYYLRTRELKGRPIGHPKEDSPSKKKAAAAKAKVVRLKATVSKLETALSAAQAALSKQRQSARKTAAKRSDGKTTAKERQSSKEYRDKHKQKLNSKAKKTASSGGSSKSSKGSSSTKSKGLSDMTTRELQTRILKIKSALRDAKAQLSNANQQLGQLAHSAITSEPNVNEHFARFQSAERIPSK